MADWEALEQTIAGEVLTPEAPGYEAARKPAIARFHDVRPQAVVRCRAPEDVIAAMAVGVPVAARSGGHCFAGRSTTTGVVIDVGPLDGVSVSDGHATVGAGARLGRVYDALLEHGVTIPAGCGPEVGIAGLTLGGGLGIMGRRHGLTSDSLVGARWRSTGGSSSATSSTSRSCSGRCGARAADASASSPRSRSAPCPRRRRRPSTCGSGPMLFHSWRRGRRGRPTRPDELAASLVITAGPDPAEPPDVKVFGAMLGSRAETEALLSDFDPASARSSSTARTAR